MSVLSLLAVLVGALLVGTCVWMRRGRSPHSRFWVRRWTSWDPRPTIDAEVFCLVWWPVVGIWLVIAGAAGLIKVIGAGPRNLSAVVALGTGLLALAVIAALMIRSGIARASRPGRTALLRPWIYPPWLRELRATERRWEKEQRLPVWERTEVGTHPWNVLAQSGAPEDAREMPPS